MVQYISTQLAFQPCNVYKAMMPVQTSIINIEENIIMLVVFYSETGNCAEFVDRTELEAMEIITGDETTTEKFVIVTPTTGDADVPDAVLDFLENHEDQVVGVVGSGNMGWADTYCAAAFTIAEDYNVPVLLEIEDEGTDEDVETFKAEFAKLV